MLSAYGRLKNVGSEYHPKTEYTYHFVPLAISYSSFHQTKANKMVITAKQILNNDILKYRAD